MTVDSVQRAFDRVLPAIKTQPTPPAAQPPVAPPVEPVKQQQQKPVPEPPTPPVSPEPKHDEVDVPSFLEQALRGEEPTPPAAAPTEDEWPEELPSFKNSDEAKARYKKWREAHKGLRDELKALKERPSVIDPTTKQRMEFLETQNKQMSEVLTRLGVEQSAEFQQKIMAPLHASWNEAARIVRDGGGDPQALARAMTLTGRAQFEALDEVFDAIPESAKSEANEALRVYRRYEEARRQAVANAPQALEGIRKRETEREMATIQKQRDDMKNIFDNAVKRLRDDAKLEVLLRTDKPEGDWWNSQGDAIVKQARELYLENTDMNRVAMACLLAPAADTYRKLWLNSQKKIGQLQKVINDRIGNEPNLSESGGSQRIATPDQQLADDLKRPFSEVFLREFHRQQAQGR